MSKPEEFQRYSRTSGFTEGGSGKAQGIAGDEGVRVPEGETFEQKLARIKRELEAVPTEPGVYLWKDAAGEVIYVGKAKQLRARMRQYVNYQDERAKIPLLVDQIDSFDYLVVENEHESLVLEKNLINQHAPFFNADFKDDKSYPFIALTKGDVFPAIKYTREKHRADTKYFGPYTDSRAARDMVDIARRVVPLCATSCADWRRIRSRSCRTMPARASTRTWAWAPAPAAAASRPRTTASTSSASSASTNSVLISP